MILYTENLKNPRNELEQINKYSNLKNTKSMYKTLLYFNAQQWCSRD